MSSNILKEFLVAIGFKVDESGFKKATDATNKLEGAANAADRAFVKQERSQNRAAISLRSLANTAVAATVLIEGATIAFSAYASKIAQRLEAMAYASERTRSSVADLRAFSVAVSQLGGTVGGALNDMESFALKLRENPQGYTAFLKGVGVEARDAKGNIRGATELYKEFRAQVGRKPYEQQLLYAQEMGISESTWRATDPARLAAEEAAQRAKYARMNYDPDSASEGAKNLQRALRNMQDSLGIIGEKAASKIFADVGDNLKTFNTFLEQHGDQIAAILSKIAQAVLAVSQALLEMLTSDKVKDGLDWLLGMFGHVDKDTGKWIADTEKIKVALEALATFVATVFVAKITGGIREILKELTPLLALLAPFAAALGLPALGTAAVGGALIAGSDPSRGITHGGRPSGSLNPGDELPGAGGGTSGGGEGAWSRVKGIGRSILGAVGLGGGGSAKIGNWWTAERQQHAFDTLTKGGVSELGAKALIARWSAVEAAGGPTSVNPRSGAFGIAQWLSRDRLNGIRGNTDYDAQLAYVLKELHSTERRALGQLNGATTEAEAAIGASMYERAENYNGRTGIDDFTGQTANAMKKLKLNMQRMNANALRGIGAATQGFDPSSYLSAPPLGPSSTDNSVRQQSYRGGDTHVTINSHGDARETAEIWRRHGERQKADDMRYASSMFA